MNIFMIPTEVKPRINPKGTAFIAIVGMAPNFEQDLLCFLPMKDLESAEKYIVDQQMDNPQRLAEMGLSVAGTIVDDKSGQDRVLLRLMQIQRLEGAALASLRQQMRLKDMVVSVRAAYEAGDIDGMYRQVTDVAHSIGLAMKASAPQPKQAQAVEDAKQQEIAENKPEPTKPQSAEIKEQEPKPVDEDTTAQVAVPPEPAAAAKAPVRPAPKVMAGGMRPPVSARPTQSAPESAPAAQKPSAQIQSETKAPSPATSEATAQPNIGTDSEAAPQSAVESPKTQAEQPAVSVAPKPASRFQIRRINVGAMQISAATMARLLQESESNGIQDDGPTP